MENVDCTYARFIAELPPEFAEQQPSLDLHAERREARVLAWWYSEERKVCVMQRGAEA